jgi:hypothetical protein
MRWERRRPVWPLIGGLACLFGLTIAAPYLWQHPVLNVHQLIERRKLVRPVEHQQLPARATFDFETLRSMHTALKGMVDATQAQVQQVQVEKQQPKVVVTSKNDRLAMLDSKPRQISLVDQPTHVSKPSAEQSTLPVSVEMKTPLLRQAPKLLIDRLEKLSTSPLAFEWSNSVLSRLQQLTENSATSPVSGLQIISELKQLAEAGQIRSLEIADPAIQQNWLQAAQGLQRRLGVWELLMERGSAASITPTYNATGNMMPVVTDVTSLLAGAANGDHWRDYLLLDQLAAASTEGLAEDFAGRARLAQEVLSRMNDSRLTPEQRTFIASEPMANLSRELKPWAAGVVDLEKLLAIIERYESNGQMLYGSAVAQLTQRMMWSNDVRLQEAATELQDEFRSPNMRIALNHEMFNRMIPDQPSVTTPVSEYIAGTKVDGRSKTMTDVSIKLVPADNAWQISLQALGHVYSKTRSDTWLVWVRNDARYEYEAEKLITIGKNGLEIAPTQAVAQGDHRYLGAESRLDGVPLMGMFFRNIAKKENQRSRPQAYAQVRSKVTQKARRRMDSEADAKLHSVEERFTKNVLGPFSQLALAAEPVDMFTTSDRAVMQLRLANLDQLAAHTPRPSAPADSVLSLQLHETAINNALAGLELDGRRFTMPELYEHLSKKLGRTEIKQPEDLPTRARIEFAKHDAIHIAFVEDRLELVLNIRELGQGRDKIQNFQVHAYYRPHLDGMAVKFVRDETLQFSGRNLKTGGRIVLHSVMGKMFAKNQEIGVIRKALESDKRLTGLMVTQLVIDDGWMALALGPTTADRTAWRTPNYVLDGEMLK